MAKPLNPSPLLDYLIAEKGMKNDAAIARKLNVNPSVMSKIRSDSMKYPVSDEVRIGVMRHFGLTLKQLDQLAPQAMK